MIGPAPSRDDRWNPTLHAGTGVTGFPSDQASTDALSSWRTVVCMRGASPLVGVRMRAGVGPCRAVLGGCYERGKQRRIGIPWEDFMARSSQNFCGPLFLKLGVVR